MSSSETSAPIATVIIIQDDVLRKNAQMNKLISRLAWISFCLGILAFYLHYVSVNRLSNISPCNAGMISGLAFIITGIAEIFAAHRPNSSGYLRNARLFSIFTCTIFAPGLIAASVGAFALEAQELKTSCQKSPTNTHGTLFGNSFELYASDTPCWKIVEILNYAQIINAIQLVIGVIEFLVQLAFISFSQKVLQRLADERNNKIEFNPTSSVTNGG